MPKIRQDENIYVGIDPGQSGGIARLWVHSDSAEPMPATERDILTCLQEVAEEIADKGGKAYACIENVHSMPGQGVSSSFKFGQGLGGLRMALIAAGIPFEPVQPRTWQKAFGIQPRGKTEAKPAFKQRLRAKAQELFPELNVTLKTADALLIALYCKRKHEGTL